MRVLIVENTPAIADMEGEYLRLIGAEYDVASTGTEGYSLFKNSDYDFYILSVMLPEMNGFELCRHIRRDSISPIIFVSACSDEASKIRAFSLGADDYVEKPFSGAELVARIRAHYLRYLCLSQTIYNPKRIKSGEVMKIRDLTIDRAKHAVLVGNRDINLTAKEFSLLEFMTDNPNRILSRSELYAAVWGEDAICEYSTVTVHIKHLREKIEPPNSCRKYIETIWGVGYKFIA